MNHRELGSVRRRDAESQFRTLRIMDGPISDGHDEWLISTPSRLAREVERDNPLFAPDGLLTERDVRRIAQWRWGTPRELPERSALIPKIAALAFGMQERSGGGGASQVRIGFDDALALLAHERDEDIVSAGVALSVLDEDAAHDEVMFFHQLVRESFAGRRLAAPPQPERVQAAGRAEASTPALGEGP